MVTKTFLFSLPGLAVTAAALYLKNGMKERWSLEREQEGPVGFYSPTISGPCAAWRPVAQSDPVWSGRRR